MHVLSSVKSLNFILITLGIIFCSGKYTSAQLVTIGSSTFTSSSNTITPYRTWYEDGRSQFLIRASELTALGATAGDITSLAFDVTTAQDVMNNANVRIAHTNLTSLTGFVASAFTTCWSGTHSPTVGWNTHTFTTNFTWNGTQNIIVEYCFDNDVWGSSSTIRYSSTTFNSNAFAYTDGSTGCSLTINSTNSSRPNMRLNFATAPMSYISSSVTQNTADTYQGSVDQQILGLEINVTGSTSAFDLTNLQFNMNGTSLADVSNINIYYSGSSSTYSATNQFGTTTAPSNGSISVSGNQTLVDGTNYFWIAYDIAPDPTSTAGNTVDASIESFTLNGAGGGVHTDMSPTSPVGDRLIKPTPGSFSKVTDQNAFGRDVMVDPNTSSYVWVGYTYEAGITSGSSDICVIKTDYAGDIIWSKAIGGTDDDQAYEVKLLSDGNYLIVGGTKTYGTNNSSPTTDYNIFAIKIDPNGSIIWTREIDDYNTYDSDYGYAAIEMSTGNIAVVGVGNSDIDVTILSPGGAVLYNREIYGPSVSSKGLAVLEASDNTLVIAGSMNNDFYVTKLTAAGAQDWVMKWGGGNTDEIVAIVENGSDDYTVLGNTYSYGAGSRDMYAMRFSYDGTGSPSVLWNHAIGTSSYETANAACASDDGGYVLTGITSGLGVGGDAVYTVKIDGNGLIVWSSVIGTGSNDDEGYGIALASDGGYVVQGLSNSPGSRFYMNRLGPNGFNCSSIGSGGAITVLATPSFTTSYGGIVNDDFGSSNSTFTPILNTGYTVTDICNTVVLPIELASFYGENIGDKNYLEWITVSEYNTAYFELEKSRDGTFWEQLGTTTAAGLSSQMLTYSMYDNSPYNLTYYRLITHDQDGTKQYSPVIAIHLDTTTEENISDVFPNPAVDNIQFYISGLRNNSILDYTILDPSGKLLKQGVINVNGQMGVYTIDISELRQGVYMINFSDQNTTHKFIKAN